MRATIRQLLISNVPQVSGRVFEPFAADAKTEKPYLMLKEGVQSQDAEWSAFSTVIEVWPYVARSSFQQVDAIANTVINALHRARFAEAGQQYLIEYQDTSRPDYFDEDWNAITRGLRFRVFELGWLNSLTYAPDPIATMQGWTAQTYPALQTNPNTWTPADATPGLYWRLLRLTTNERTPSVDWLEAQIAGHILAPSPAIRLLWARRITEELSRKRTLRMSDGGVFELMRIAADSEANAMTRGQIQVVARFGILQTVNPTTILNRAMTREV